MVGSLFAILILEISNQIQQAVIILKLQMNIPVSILVRSEFNKLFLQEKGFGSCLSVKDSGSSRLGVGNIFGSNAPFFEFQDQWSPDGSINSLGGKQSCVGIEQIGLSRSLWFTNVELRYRFLETIRKTTMHLD
jgi:hypothetical protein